MQSQDGAPGYRSGQHASGCVICDSGFGSLSSGYRVGGDAGIPPRTKASR